MICGRRRGWGTRIALGLASVALAAGAVLVADALVSGPAGGVSVQATPEPAATTATERPSSPETVAVGDTPTSDAVVTDAASDPASDTSAALSAPAVPARFVPVDPSRLLDTRPDAGARLSAGGSVDVSVPELDGVAATDVVAVAVNLTMVDAGGAGYLTAWPAGSPRPEVSNVNAAGGPTGSVVPNFAIVPVRDATFSVYASVPTDLLVDLAGVYVAAPGPATAGRTIAIEPVRRLDTRTGDRPGAGASLELRVAGTGSVPSSASAVLATVTATRSVGPGYVTVWPAGRERPNVSTLNLTRSDQTVANVAIVPVGDHGSIELFTDAGTDLIVDVVGYVTDADATASTDGLFLATVPHRDLDTRQGSGQRLVGNARADAGLDLPSGIDPSQVAMAALNLTLTDTSQPLYLTAYAARTRAPQTSNVNADQGGQTVAAFGLVPLGAEATVSIRPSARTHAIVDVSGYFLGEPTPADPALAPHALGPQGSEPIGPFDAAVAGFLIEHQLAGATVAVAEDGRLVYVRSYGTSDTASGAPMRIDDHFRIASISKVMTGTTIMRLDAAGRLDLDDRVWPLLNSKLRLPATADPRASTITIRQLLGHVSGIPASPDPFFDDQTEVLAAFGMPGPSSCAAGAAWALARPLGWDPGTTTATRTRTSASSGWSSRPSRDGRGTTSSRRKCSRREGSTTCISGAATCEDRSTSPTRPRTVRERRRVLHGGDRRGGGVDGDAGRRGPLPRRPGPGQAGHRPPHGATTGGNAGPALDRPRHRRDLVRPGVAQLPLRRRVRPHRHAAGRPVDGGASCRRDHLGHLHQRNAEEPPGRVLGADGHRPRPGAGLAGLRPVARSPLTGPAVRPSRHPAVTSSGHQAVIVSRRGRRAAARWPRRAPRRCDRPELGEVVDVEIPHRELPDPVERPERASSTRSMLRRSGS
ncbi:MAG: serine hydrolase domain-containing protein [Ilumatobacteraceae bacterium]